MSGQSASGGKKQQKKQQQKHRDSAMPDDEDWHVVRDSASVPTPAASSSSKGGKPASGGAKLTPTQRKALHKAGQNPNRSAKQREKASVEVEDEDEDGEQELIDEEEEERSDLDDGSGSDSDGEADWEKDDPKPKSKSASSSSAAASSSSPTSPSSSWLPSFRTLLLWSFILAVIGGLVWIRLQDSAIWEGIDPDDVVSTPPSEQEDYYKVLQVDRNADLRAIKTSYRKLVLKTHPDKNPNCVDCAGEFQRVQRAYDVLSNSDKRKMYDSIETSFDLLRSDTTELTHANFHSEVLASDAVWVIQVYTDWHKSAIRFSQAWEEAAQRHGKLLHFGRIHASRERELVRTLPVKFGVIPAILVYANGQFSQSKTFLDSSHTALNKLSAFLAAQFPNTVESVAPTKRAIQDFFKQQSEAKDGEHAAVLFFPDFVKQAAQARRQQQIPQGGSNAARFQQQMLQTNTRGIDEPSLTYKAVARQFQYAVRFGQVQHLKDAKEWKKWAKEIGQAFKLTPPSQLPALLYTESGDPSPKWLTGNLNKERLLRHMDGLHRRMVPHFNSHAYARHCVDSSNKKSLCVLAVACQPPRIGELEFHSFSSGARSMLKQAAFKGVPLQFGKVDISKNPDMTPLCEALPKETQQSQELSIVVIGDRGRTLYHYASSSHRAQQFDAWLTHVLKGDGSVQATEAPLVPVVHVPDDVWALHVPQLKTVIYIPLKWLYGGLILASIIIFFPLISKHFGTFVWLVFAASIIVPGFELLKDVADKYFA